MKEYAIKPKSFFSLVEYLLIQTHLLFTKNSVLDRLVELSRICLIPLQIILRSTTGKCFGRSCFMLFQKNGALIQWKLTTSEISRSFTDLSKPDLEETVLKSKPGAYDKATEFEIVSL